LTGLFYVVISSANDYTFHQQDATTVELTINCNCNIKFELNIIRSSHNRSIIEYWSSCFIVHVCCTGARQADSATLHCVWTNSGTQVQDDTAWWKSHSACAGYTTDVVHDAVEQFWW